MISILKDRYKFVDISVLMRVNRNAYTDLTLIELGDNDDYIYVNTKSVGKNPKFLLTFCTFIRKERYVAEITVNELLALAGIKDGRYPDRLLRDAGEELTAAICARKIVGYKYGSAQQIKQTGKGYVYSFSRQENRESISVFEKEFINTGEIGE